MYSLARSHRHPRPTLPSTPLSPPPAPHSHIHPRPTLASIPPLAYPVSALTGTRAPNSAPPAPSPPSAHFDKLYQCDTIRNTATQHERCSIYSCQHLAVKS